MYSPETFEHTMPPYADAEATRAPVVREKKMETI
jgi:hypothetical protein